jgi:hypothetical protein
MGAMFRRMSVLGMLCLTPAVAHADPVEIASGFFGIIRPLTGTSAVDARLIWETAPPELFAGQPPPYIYSLWDSGEYTSDLLGTTAPVLPFPPGPVAVGGAFTTGNVSLLFVGGEFVIPSAFPATDEEGLYTVTEPYTMRGHWTVDVPIDAGTVRFDRDISAHGHARLIMGADPTTGNSILWGVVYDFEGPTPVPEPSTLVLLGIGALLTFVRAWRP